jgi:deoxyribonuclease-4
MQVFTKNPNRWLEPVPGTADVDAFKEERERCGIVTVFAHDSYLINLASPDAGLREKSLRSFRGELQRCAALGIEYVVTHPGNHVGARDGAVARNAEAYSRCLSDVPGPAILIETTAGAGTALGATFEELHDLREAVTARERDRVGFCADTCHLFAAGYDLVGDWDGVWHRWEEVIGLQHLACVHLNDSKHPLGSRKDRHELIGEGEMGPTPFRRFVSDARFVKVPGVIETPKLGDPFVTDRRMIERLRSYRTQTNSMVD